MVFLAGATMVGAPTCADNESSVYVRAMMHVPVDSCLVKPDPSSEVLARGTLDVSFRYEYSGFLLMANQLVRRGDPDRLRIETSKIEFYEADVSVFESSKDGPLLGEFRTPISGFADASTSGSAGLGLVYITMIDAALGQELANTIKPGQAKDVVVDVVVYGRTLGGIEVSSWDWYFPVLVCNGCLCNLAPCLSLSMDMAAENCRPGLDDMVDCRLGLSSCQP
jgi:hypothetical protein